MVKRILRKYKYPPDRQEAAVQLALDQTETLSAEWGSGAGHHEVPQPMWMQLLNTGMRDGFLDEAPSYREAYY